MQKQHQSLVSSAPTGEGPLLPSAIPAGLTIQKVRDTFHRYLKAWKESSCFKELTKILEQLVLASDGVRVERCVCLGLGSFTGGVPSDASMYELAALVSILEILCPFLLPPIFGLLLMANDSIATKFDIEEVYMQDPVFNRMDEEFLRGLGHTILSTPDGFSKLTSTTFLFAPHLEWPNYIQALQIATPSLCIGNCVKEYLDQFQPSPESKDLKISETLQAFADKTSSLEMPAFDRALWCSSTSVYWRKERDEDEATGNGIQNELKKVELEGERT